MNQALLAIWAVWVAMPNYGCPHCTCGTHATPDKTCPVHWALWVLEHRDFDYQETASGVEAMGELY